MYNQTFILYVTTISTSTNKMFDTIFVGDKIKREYQLMIREALCRHFVLFYYKTFMGFVMPPIAFRAIYLKHFDILTFSYSIILLILLLFLLISMYIFIFKLLISDLTCVVYDFFFLFYI